MSLDELFLNGEEKMEKAVNQLKKGFASIRSGRANPLVLDKVTKSPSTSAYHTEFPSIFIVELPPS